MTGATVCKSRRNKGKVHQCAECKHTYTRLDHLKRHLRTHRSEKPYQCQICGTCYGRADVLRRHGKKCQQQSGGRLTPGSEESEFRQYHAYDTPRDAASPVSHIYPVGESGSMAHVTREFPAASIHCSPGYVYPESLFSNGAPRYDASPSGLDGRRKLDSDILLKQTDLVGCSVPSPRRPWATQEVFVSDLDVSSFKRRLSDLDTFGRLAEFDFPSRSRLARCLEAFFHDFSPHVPIIHRPSFYIGETHPILILAMTSIGAVHTGEQDFADRTYEALYHLLLDFDNSRGMDVGRDLWPAQAALLCSQFGVLNDSVERSRQAERQLLLVASFLRSSLAEVEIKSTRRDSDWSTWTFLETYFRLAACKMATAGMLLAIDPGSVSIIAQQETRMVFATDDEVWEAPTETIWRERFQAHGCAYDIEVPVVSHTLMAGTEVYCFVSSFGLFALIASVWTHIVSCERLQLGLANNFDLATRNRLEATLQAWQTMWSDYFELRESKCLSSYPIMEDCLPLLTSCYYHLYVGPELRQLKALAIQERTGERIPIPAVGDLAPTLKAVRYAVQAWQVRLHHGIARTKLAGPLQCSPQTLTCAFEAALILAWWIYSTNDSERNPLNTTSNAEQDQLQGQLRSIYRELEEQGWCDESMPVWSRPLLSIRDMVCTGAWPYAEKMRRLLLTFYDRLARIDANRSRQQIDVTISDA